MHGQRKQWRVFVMGWVMMAAMAVLLPVAAAQAPAKPMSDESIRQAIVKRFSASKIGANGFQVEVKGGVATLRGEAEVAQHKGVATRLAKLGGAREVDNQITISAAGKQRLRETLQKRKAGARTAKPQAAAGEIEAPARTDQLAKTTSAVPAASSSQESPEGAMPNAETDATSGGLPRFAVKPKPEAKRGEARSERRRY